MSTISRKNAALYTVVFSLIVVSTTLGNAFAQSEIPEDVPVNFSASQAIVVGLGIAGGLTVAFLGNSQASKEDSDYKFDARKFARPVIIAVLTAIPLAITAATGLMELNLVTMFMIYTATLGTAELSKRVK